MRAITLAVFWSMILFFSTVHAQDLEPPIRVHEAIGDTLDPQERLAYNLFPKMDGFQYAVFFLNHDSTLRATVHVYESSGARDIEVPRYRTLASLRDHINKTRMSLSQDRTDRVYLSNGSILVGLILEQTPEYVQIKTSALGIVKVSMQEIDRIENNTQTMQDVVQGFAFNDPNTTRAFLMPTAQTLPAGSGSIGVFELFLLTVTWAPAEHLMVNGGLILLPFSLEDQVINFGIKWGFGEVSQNIELGMGAQFLTVPGESPIGVGYGVASFGNADHKLNLGLGFGFALDEGATSDPVALLSGDTRLSESVKFLGEAWILPGSEVIPFTLGFRFFGTRLSGDIGLLYIIGVEMESPIGIPVGSLIYNF